MAGFIYIPEPVRHAIEEHVVKRVRDAVDLYWSGAEDEDTLTGQLGALLQAGPRQVVALEDSREGQRTWTWMITYTKFRGRGPRATERFIGADGVIELRVRRSERGEPEGEQTKSVLFQAKNRWGNTDTRLLQQSLTLSTWREASFVLNYTSDQFTAYPLDAVVAARGNAREAGNPTELAQFLCESFLPCSVGDTYLRYDARRRLLHWRDQERRNVSTDFAVGNRIRVDVRARPGTPVRPENIHQHRMWEDDEKILSTRGIAPTSLRAVARAKKALALTYHPDRFDALDRVYRDIAERRMKEVNAAASRLKSRWKK